MRYGLIGVLVLLLLVSIVYLLARLNPDTPLAAFVGSLSSIEGPAGSGDSPSPSARDISPGGARAQVTDEIPTDGSGRPEEAPAGPGAELSLVDTPPERTLSALSVPEGFTTASYQVVFEPYGWGPGGAEGGYLVIGIIEAQRGAGAEELPDLSGRNAIVGIDAQVAETVTEGGRYTAELQVLRGPEGRGELRLKEVRRAR